MIISQELYCFILIHIPLFEENWRKYVYRGVFCMTVSMYNVNVQVFTSCSIGDSMIISRQKAVFWKKPSTLLDGCPKDGWLYDRVDISEIWLLHACMWRVIGNFEWHRALHYILYMHVNACATEYLYNQKCNTERFWHRQVINFGIVYYS